MDFSEKPRIRRGILTIEMRKKVLAKAVKAARFLLDDPNPEIRLSAIHSIAQVIGMLGKLENPVEARAAKRVGEVTRLSSEQTADLLEIFATANSDFIQRT